MITKAKVGDRIKINDSVPGMNRVLWGKTGTVTEVTEANSIFTDSSVYTVNVDDDAVKGRWVRGREFTVISSTPEPTSFLDAIEDVIYDQGYKGYDDTEAMVRITRLVVSERARQRKAQP